MRQLGKPVQHLNALTGLRFLAALLVFVHHVTGHFGIPKIRAPLGAIGVGFFFVLSGFILTYVYSGRLKWGGLRRFYVSRWARIWPLHLVCLLAVICIYPQKVALISANPIQCSKLISNFGLFQSWIPTEHHPFAFNGVSWSISTELAFYLLFPLMLLGGQKAFWKRYLFIVSGTFLAVFAVQLWLNSGTIPSWFHVPRFFNTFPLIRFAEFCTGMAAGFYFLKTQSRAAEVSLVNSNAIKTRNQFLCWTVIETLAFLAIVLFVVFVNQSRVLAWLSRNAGQAIGQYTCYSSGMFLFAGFIYVFARSRGLWNRILSTRPAVFLGEISFAFYMVHFIVLSVVWRLVWTGSESSPVAMAAVVFFISLGLSILLFKWVERPARAGIMDVYDGNFRKGFLRFLSATGEDLRKPATLVAVAAMILMPVGLFYFHYRPAKYSTEIQRVVDRTKLGFKYVEFENGLKMVGIEEEVVPNGVCFKIAWVRINDEYDGKRQIVIVDRRGKILGYGPWRESSYYAKHKKGEPFSETVVINRRLLEMGGLLTLSFRPDGKGPRYRINGGTTVCGSRMLSLVNRDDRKRLSQEREELLARRQAELAAQREAKSQGRAKVTR